VRPALISAIAACAEHRSQRKARKFLQGLSTDELQYIAEFLGAYVLESGQPGFSRRELADHIARFEQVRCAPPKCRADQDHKMILLLEYMCSSGSGRLALRA